MSRTGRLAAAGLAVLCAVAAATASVAAPRREASARPARTLATNHTYNARYCELLFVNAAKPRGFKADTWNTLRLGRCPVAWWHSLDAAHLAKQNGALLVLLNGPRFFVMDRASITDPGPVRSFGGQRLRLWPTSRSPP